MRYTVIGLYSPESSDILVAGVAEGELTLVATRSTSWGYERVATEVEANSPDEAERVALARFGSSLDPDQDTDAGACD